MTAHTSSNSKQMHWLVELQQYMTDSERSYGSCKSNEDRRRYATLTFAGLLDRLGQRAALQGIGSLRVLSDIQDFLDDVHRGRNHNWRSLGPYGGLQQYTRTEERLRNSILVSIEIALDVADKKRGYKNQAFRQIAQALPSYGHQMSEGRVKGLYYENRRGAYPHGYFISQFMADYWHGNALAGEIAFCIHGDPVHRCRASGGERCSEIRAAAGLAVSFLLSRV